MKTMNSCRLSLIVLGLLLLVGGAHAEVGWLIYPYTIPTKDEEYQRLLNCEEAEYMGFQWHARSSYTEDLHKTRAAELARAGKKLIVDLWFGASRPFSWRYYNMPGIALNPQVRQDFFDKCTDPFLEHYGVENLYAVHLFEESGGQFGYDVDVPGYPDDEIGYENGSNMDNPLSFEGWGRSVSGSYVLNIHRYNDFLLKTTGMDMRLAAIWSEAERNRFKNWVQQTMEAGAHVQFAKHVHEKYPGLRVYAFNGLTAAIAQAEVLDGHFTDPYSSTVGVYQALRRYRSIMRPEADLVAMVWGNRTKPIPQRMPQQAACFLAGSDVLSTFGDWEAGSDEWLNVVRDSVRPFIGLPRFESQPPVLFIGGQALFGATLHSGQYWVTGFADHDVQGVPGPLDQYELVFSWGGSHPELADWVRDGGILVGVHSGAELLIEAGLLEDTRKRSAFAQEYRPDPWMRENFGLAESYTLDMSHVHEYAVKDEATVKRDQFLYVAPYGRGLVVLLPAVQHVHPPWQYEPSWEVYRQLVTDVCRGALLYRGLDKVAEDAFCDPKLGNDYLKMTSRDGSLTVYALLTDSHGPNKSQTSFVVKGYDRVTGKEDVTFGEEHPVVVIENR